MSNKPTEVKADAKRPTRSRKKAVAVVKADEVKDRVNDIILTTTDDGDDDFNLMDVYEPDINPNWDKSGTVEELERDLTGFKFNGPGWYNYRHDTLLVISEGREADKMWAQTHNDIETFRVYVFSGPERSPQESFGFIATAPTRTY